MAIELTWISRFSVEYYYSCLRAHTKRDKTILHHTSKELWVKQNLIVLRPEIWSQSFNRQKFIKKVWQYRNAKNLYLANSLKKLKKYLERTSHSNSFPIAFTDIQSGFIFAVVNKWQKIHSTKNNIYFW
jgi:DNA-binding winged helix-turn-helix (wHTH) protein